MCRSAAAIPLKCAHPIMKVLLDFFQKIAESRGRASGRPPQRAKYPLAAASETPAPHTARNTRPPQRAKHPKRPKAPSADGAIPGQGPWSAPPPLWGGRRGPSANAVSDAVPYGLDTRWYTPAAENRFRPTEWNVLDGLVLFSAYRLAGQESVWVKIYYVKRFALRLLLCSS